MRRYVLAAACAMLIGPAFGQSIGEKTGINAALGVTPRTADFVREVAIGDMFEIGSSQLAAQRTGDPTKNFASQMIDDHTKTTTELKALVQGGGVSATLPTRMDSSHQTMLDGLKGLSGINFARRYHSEQVSAHKDAVSLFQRYARGGDNPALKDWASKTLPTLQHRLQMAQDLAK